MQKITREQLISKASELLSSGTVSCVFGWKKGEFDYDVTPAVFNTVEALNADYKAACEALDKWRESVGWKKLPKDKQAEFKANDKHCKELEEQKKREELGKWK